MSPQQVVSSLVARHGKSTLAGVVGLMLGLSWQVEAQGSRLAAVEAQQRAQSEELRDTREFLRVLLKIECKKLTPEQAVDLDLDCPAILRGRTLPARPAIAATRAAVGLGGAP